MSSYNDSRPCNAARVAEFCAGYGGLGQGLKLVLPDARVGLYVEREAPAVQILAARMQEGSIDSAPIWSDARTILDELVRTFGEVRGLFDIICAGFPCFRAGTRILSKKGFLPIEEISVGDSVLTHQGRWRTVTSTMSRWANSTRILRGQGFPDIHTTDEHPFLTRQRCTVYNSDTAKTQRGAYDPKWTPARDIDNSVYVGQVLPPVTGDPEDRSPDFWWIVGRYLADGWRVVCNKKGRVVICANAKEAEYVKERINRVFHCCPTGERTVIKFHITRKWFYEYLEQFGTLAAGKNIPGWALGLDAVRADAFLDGYLTGDGNHYENGQKATTVSRSLALGIALLSQRVRGVVASIHEANMPAQTVIEGRVVNQQKQYQIVIPDRNNSAFLDGNYGWKPVRSNKEGPGCQVYNISVEEDESYIADGVIVHNCQDISLSGKRAGLSGSRSGLWFNILETISQVRPRLVFLENVPGLLSPIKEKGQLIDPAPLGRVLGDLAEIGYDSEWISLSAAQVGASHKRERVFMLGWLAHDDGFGRNGRSGSCRARRSEPSYSSGSMAHNDDQRLEERRVHSTTRLEQSSLERGSASVADSDSMRELQSQRREPELRGRSVHGGDGLDVSELFPPGPADEIGWFIELIGRLRFEGTPRSLRLEELARLAEAASTFGHGQAEIERALLRALNGPSARVDLSRTDRLRAIGNGVVPLQAAVALQIMLHRAGLLNA